MTEETQGQKDTVAQPQPPVPSEETGEPKGEAPEQSQDTKPEGLPEDAKDRTKREFDKLQTQLRDERARREYYEQLFSQTQPQQEQSTFTDPVEATAQEALKIANEAKQRLLEAQRDQENQKLFTAHPDLNPDNKDFNKKVHNLTSSLLVDNMMHPDAYDGKTLDPVEAATMAKTMLGVNLDEVRKQAANEAIEQLTPKEQASLAAVGSPGGRTQIDNLEELRIRSRGRDDEARLARIERFNRIIKKQE